eukprot:m.348938 g.348938  ORF g.348938 m.348938 type:complete len:60 (-) comp20683_c0_seq11:352-531(-)
MNGVIQIPRNSICFRETSIVVHTTAGSIHSSSATREIFAAVTACIIRTLHTGYSITVWA